MRWALTGAIRRAWTMLDKAGVDDAVSFIETLRQASDLTALPVGRNVVVIGGGMMRRMSRLRTAVIGRA